MSEHARASRRPAGPFARWRRSRPFWGGLLTALAGAEIVAAPLAPLPYLVYQGIAGISGYLIGAALIALGVLAWLHPAQRAFYGIVAVLLSLTSFLTSNFGGFVVGMLLGIVGGALVFAWTPHRGPKPGRPRGHDTVPEADEDGGTDGEDAAGERDAAAADGGEEEAVDRGGGRGGAAHALVAVPLALGLLLAPAPTDWWWPWDDWFDRGGDEQGEPETPPATPAPDPSPSAPPGDEGEPQADGAPDDTAEQGAEEEEEETGEADAACEIRTGPAEQEATEEEFLAAVEACQRAAEDGEALEVQVLRADEPFPASPVTSGLTADSIVMSGSYFAGVVEYPTSGGTDHYLRLRMSRADFDNAVLWWMDGPERISIDLPDMTMQGDVVLHVTRMEVRLLGIRLVFTPDFPPPLLLPYMIVTDVDVAGPVAQSQILTVEGIRVRPGH